MKPQQLFEVLAEIASEHDRDVRDNLLVVPVLTDEMESRRGLLDEVASFLGGMLIDSTDGSYNEALSALDDATLRGILDAELSFDRDGGGGRTETRMIYEDGQIDVELTSRGRLVTVPSPAETQLMALARSLFDTRLESHELAILLYDETTLDETTQRVVLRMLTGLGRQTGLRLGSARTLVPFIHSAGLDRGRHCQPFRGVRYSLSGDEVVRRNPAIRMQDTIQKLTAVRDEPLVLFLGAGFSVSSKMPIGNAVRNATIRRLCSLPDEADGLTDLELGAALFRFADEPGRDLLSPREQELGESDFAASATLEQAVRIERDQLEVAVPPTIADLREQHDARLADTTDPFGDAVYALHKIIEDGRRVVIVTVNFDELIEHEHIDRLDVVVDDADFERIAPVLAAMRTGGAHPEGKVPLLKLHGTISRPETCVATDDVTRSGITRAKREALMALVIDLPEGIRLPWVYVGASMRDIDLDGILAQREFNEGVSERWVAPWPEASVSRFVYTKNRWWAAQGKDLLSRTVTETADAFMKALVSGWA